MLLHRRFPDDSPVAPKFFRRIASHIRPIDGFGDGNGGIEHGHAEGRRDVKRRVSLMNDADFGKFGSDPLDHRPRRIEIRMWGTKKKFFSAIAEKPIERTNIAHDVMREGRQRPITNEMSILVVDRFEFVDIHHDDHAGLKVAFDEFMLFAKLGEQANASAGASQSIDIVNLVLKLMLQCFDLKAHALHFMRKLLVDRHWNFLALA